MTVEGTIAMLRLRQDEHLATVGLVAALFCDDLDEAVRRLEIVSESARDFERAAARGDRRQKSLGRGVSELARDLLVPMRQVRDSETRSVR